MVKITFLENRVVQDGREGTKDETSFEKSKSYDLHQLSAERWIEKGAAVLTKDFLEQKKQSYVEDAAGDEIQDVTQETGSHENDHGSLSQQFAIISGKNTLLKARLIAIEKVDAQEIARLTQELAESKKTTTLTLDSKEIQDKLDETNKKIEDQQALLSIRDADIKRLCALTVRFGADPKLVEIYSGGISGDGTTHNELAQEIVAKAGKNTAPLDNPDLAKPAPDRTEQKSGKDLSPLSELTKPEADGKPKLFGAGVDAQKKGKPKK